MKPTFLCSKHRDALFSNPEQAEQRWHEWMCKGSELYDALHFKQAVPFLGCAFELAEQFLGLDWPDGESAISRFTYSSICLSRALEQVGDINAGRTITEYSDELLEDALAFNQTLTGRYSKHLNCCQKSLQHRADSSYWVNQELIKTSVPKSQKGHKPIRH